MPVGGSSGRRCRTRTGRAGATTRGSPAAASSPRGRPRARPPRRRRCSATRAAAKTGSSESGSSERARSAASAAASRSPRSSATFTSRTLPLARATAWRPTRWPRARTPRLPRPRAAPAHAGRASPAAARTPAAKSAGPVTADEVPVVVDERMDEPQRQRDGQRGGGVPLDPLEPPQRADRGDRGGGDERQEEREADEPRPGQELERNTVRLGHRRRGLAVALARDLERVRAGAGERVAPRRCPAPRPTTRAGCSSSGCAKRSGIVRDLAAAELVGDPAGVGDQRRRPPTSDGGDREPAEHAAERSRRAGDERPASRARSATSATSARAGDEEQPEPGAVGDAVRARLRRPRRAPAG